MAREIARPLDYQRDGASAGSTSIQWAVWRDARELAPTPGLNALEYVGYTTDRISGHVTFHERDAARWWQSEHVGPVSLTGLEHLGHLDAANLAQLFPVYDWNVDQGSIYFGNWVEAAAQKAGR